MSENKTEEKKFLLKQRKALWWNVADKPGVKSGDEAFWIGFAFQTMLQGT